MRSFFHSAFEQISPDHPAQQLLEVAFELMVQGYVPRAETLLAASPPIRECWCMPLSWWDDYETLRTLASEWWTSKPSYVH